MIISAACSPDMTYFPFDKQTCTLLVKPATRDYGKLELRISSRTWDTNSLEDGSTWEVTSTENTININGDKYEAELSITIKRKPLFYSLVIVFPTLLLSLLSGFVFLLPSASGERVGFGVTCFLSFVVLLQSIMGMLPEVSAPMSLLCYYVIVMLAFSVFLNVVNILLMRLHLNPTRSEVPRWLVYFVETITCKIWGRCLARCLSRRSKSGGDNVGKTRFPRLNPYVSTNGKVRKESVARDQGTSKSKANEKTPTANGKALQREPSEFKTDITWPYIGAVLDIFFLLVFCGVQAVFTIFILVPLARQYTD